MKITQQDERLAKVEKELLPQIKTAFGENLHSVIIYGSILTKQFNPLTSDVNVLIIPKEADPERIVVLGKYCAKTFTQYKITPTVMSCREFIDSADVFPMEYLDIKDKHKTIYGEDITDRLDITTRNLRHQVEDRLRGCINSLRQVLMLSDSRPRLLALGVRNTHGLYNAIFRAILRLKKHPEVYFSYKNNLTALSEYINFDIDPFLQLRSINKETPLEKVICDAILQLLIIVEDVDKMEVDG
ncbi:MAG: hypothetical protein MJ215_00025 [Spirochaetia bacterium]|nr:hypothetical protein [Spirochaetia bacterium]